LCLGFVCTDSNFRYESLWWHIILSQFHEVWLSSSGMHIIWFPENNCMYFFTECVKCFVCCGVVAPDTLNGFHHALKFWGGSQSLCTSCSDVKKWMLIFFFFFRDLDLSGIAASQEEWVDLFPSNCISLQNRDVDWYNRPYFSASPPLPTRFLLKWLRRPSTQISFHASPFYIFCMTARHKEIAKKYWI
jgi:hypothetical protein